MSTKVIESARPSVKGLDLDGNTRCLHYHGPTDIIAIRMKCCETYHACIDCHTALADHPAEVWPHEEWNHEAVLCGACGAEISINNYMNSDNRCPQCGSAFNPGCRKHYHLYFETVAPSR